MNKKLVWTIVIAVIVLAILGGNIFKKEASHGPLYTTSLQTAKDNCDTYSTSDKLTCKVFQSCQQSGTCMGINTKYCYGTSVSTIQNCGVTPCGCYISSPAYTKTYDASVEKYTYYCATDGKTLKELRPDGYLSNIGICPTNEPYCVKQDSFDSSTVKGLSSVQTELCSDIDWNQYNYVCASDGPFIKELQPSGYVSTIGSCQTGKSCVYNTKSPTPYSLSEAQFLMCRNTVNCTPTNSGQTRYCSGTRQYVWNIVSCTYDSGDCAASNKICVNGNCQLATGDCNVGNVLVAMGSSTCIDKVKYACSYSSVLNADYTDDNGCQNNTGVHADNTTTIPESSSSSSSSSSSGSGTSANEETSDACLVDSKCKSAGMCQADSDGNCASVCAPWQQWKSGNVTIDYSKPESNCTNNWTIIIIVVALLGGFIYLRSANKRG